MLFLFVAVLVFFTVTAFKQEPLASADLAVKVVAIALETAFALGAGLMAGTLQTAVQCFTAKGKGVLGEHTLEITDDGLIETTEYNRSLHRWAGIHKVTESRRFLWIYVTDTLAHIVPRRRPLIEGDLRLFEDQMRTTIKERPNRSPDAAPGSIPPATPNSPSGAP